MMAKMRQWFSKSTDVDDDEIIQSLSDSTQAQFDTFTREGRIQELSQSRGNLSRRFHKLVEENPLAEGLVDKAKSLIYGQGWTIFSESENAQAEQVLSEFWARFSTLWPHLINEAIITGGICFEPVVHPTLNTVMINFIPTSYLDDVKMENFDPVTVMIEEDSGNDPSDTSDFIAEENTPFSTPTARRVIRYSPYDDAAGNPQMGYNGEVFYFRFNHALQNRFGISRLYSSEPFIRGFAEMGGNLISRSRIMQMLSYAVNGFESTGDREQDNARKQAFINLSKGKNQIIFLGDGETIEPQTPEMRNLDLPAGIAKMLEMALLRWEFPPFLFSQPEGTNRATAAEAIKGYVQTYTELQQEFVSVARFVAHFVLTRQIPTAEAEDIGFGVPEVYRKTVKEDSEDKDSQLALLERLRGNGTINDEVFHQQSLVVMRGGTINL